MRGGRGRSRRERWGDGKIGAQAFGGKSSARHQILGSDGPSRSFSWVAITMVNIVAGFFIGCLVGVLSLGLWVAIVILHIVCIVKGVNGQRLIIPGVSEYANKF